MIAGLPRQSTRPHRMEQLYPPPARAGAVDVAAFVLSRLAHHPATAPAFVDAATGGTLSFSALHRAALSLASGLRLGLGLGLRRGDAVLVLSRNSLLLPQVLLGVLAAGAVVVAADPDATPAEIAARLGRRHDRCSAGGGWEGRRRRRAAAADVALAGPPDPLGGGADRWR